MLQQRCTLPQSWTRHVLECRGQGHTCNLHRPNQLIASCGVLVQAGRLDRAGRLSPLGRQMLGQYTNGFEGNHMRAGHTGQRAVLSSMQPSCAKTLADGRNHHPTTECLPLDGVPGDCE